MRFSRARMPWYSLRWAKLSPWEISFHGLDHDSARRTLHDDDCGEDEDDSERLDWTENFSQEQCGQQNGEDRLQATGDDRTRRFKILQAEKIKRESPQHRNHREDKQEQPLCRDIARGNDFPGRIHEKPEERGCGKRPYQDAPAVVAGQNAMSSDIVKSERKRSQQRCDQAVGVEVKSEPAG